MVKFGRKKFGRFRRPKFDLPKPVKVGEEYEVEIKEIGSKGDGIARVENFVIFVPDTKKGDKVKIRIVDVRSRFALGEKIGEAKEEEAVEEVKEEKGVEEEVAGAKEAPEKEEVEEIEVEVEEAEKEEKEEEETE